MDRPAQIGRAMMRLVQEEHWPTLRERLVVRMGPLPVDVTQEITWIRDKALELDADLVAIDSIKDVLPKASDEERAGLYNMARQAALASGIDWMELHHNRKAGVGNKEPDTLEDVYGARWLMAGAGSVISLFGESGASVVSMKQLKAPAGEFFPRWVELDKGKGMLALHDNLTVESLAARATAGTSALLVARKIYSTEKPDRSQVQSVRNKFKRLAGQGVIEEYASTVDGTQMFRATSSNALATPQQRDTATPATDTPSSQVKAATPSSNTSNDPATTQQRPSNVWGFSYRTPKRCSAGGEVEESTPADPTPKHAPASRASGSGVDHDHAHARIPDQAPEEERARREKAERLTAAGYWTAPTPGTCCLCQRRIHRGQWIGKMRDRWNPESRRRHGHYWRSSHTTSRSSGSRPWRVAP
jgi:nucleoside diphosphate kinase